jgi:CMP-N-acetylneuraminic acid synthetase
MKNIDDVCVVIQARLSSERVPRKMIRPFAETNLTDIAVKKILSSNIIPKQNFYLSVHEQELKDVAIKNDVNIFHRSEESALWDGDNGAVLGKMYEWWDKLPFKYIVLVSACCPLLKTETIDNFFKKYLESDSDGMFAVIEKKNYFWNTESVCLSTLTEAAMNTKTVAPIYEAAHCLYAGQMEPIGKGVWMGDFRNKGEIELVQVPEKEIFDIDYEWQFEFYEALYKHTAEKQK